MASLWASENSKKSKQSTENIKKILVRKKHSTKHALSRSIRAVLFYGIFLRTAKCAARRQSENKHKLNLHKRDAKFVDES